MYVYNVLVLGGGKQPKWRGNITIIYFNVLCNSNFYKLS